MDTRRLVTTLLIVGVLFLAFQFIAPKFFGGNKPPAGAAGAAASMPVYATSTTQQFSEQGAAPATLRLGNAESGSKDKVAVTVNNVTAGIELVELNADDYSDHVKDAAHPHLEPLRLMEARKGVPKPYATMKVTVTRADKSVIVADLLEHQYVWKMERDPADPYAARLYFTLSQFHVPLVRITKIFKVNPGSYDIMVSHEVENLTKEAVSVKIDQFAAIDLPPDRTQADDRFYHAAGIDTVKKVIADNPFNLTHNELKAMEEKGPREIGKFSGNDPLVWIASSGRFFVAITRPMQNWGPVFTLNDGIKVPLIQYIDSAHVDILQSAADVRDIVGGIRLDGAAVEVKGGETLSMPLAVYFGPKRSDVLRGNIHADPASADYARSLYDYNTVIQFNTGGCYSHCTFGWLGDALVWMLTFLQRYVTFGNFGLAIILLTIIIRALLHPLTRASQVNMATMSKKMKDVQPLVEASKKKYAKDKQKQNEEMMRIYREHKVNPAGGLMGCLPMLIQMPIWIAMWSALRTDIDLYHAKFIPGWINDLSAPDLTFTFAPTRLSLSWLHLPAVGFTISAINVLPLLLGVVFFIQMQVQTASQPKPADDQQASMQKMTKYMSLLFPLFLYNYPSGLNLYYFASTLGGLVDTYFVRKILKRKGILPATAQTLPTHEEK